MASEKKIILVKSWKYNTTDVRLLTEDLGYRNYQHGTTRYLLEKDVKGTLGEPKWERVHEWFTNDEATDAGKSLVILVKLVEELLKMQPVGVPPGVPDPNLVGPGGLRY